MIINTSSSAIQNARKTIDSAAVNCEEHFSRAVRDFNEAAKRVQDQIELGTHYLADAERKLTEIDNQLTNGYDKLESLENELANCRPPRWVTYTYTDDEGNTYTETVLEDPDAEKREYLEGEISQTQSKISELQEAHNNWKKYHDSVAGVLSNLRNGYESIKSNADALLPKQGPLNSQFSTQTSIANDALIKINDYNSTTITRTAPAPILHTLMFYDGQISLGGGGGSSATTNINQRKGEASITIDLMDIFKNEQEFTLKLAKIVDEHQCKIIVRIKANFPNFKYPTTLEQIDAIFASFDFTIKRNSVGVRYRTIDNKYCYIKG